MMKATLVLAFTTSSPFSLALLFRFSRCQMLPDRVKRTPLTSTLSLGLFELKEGERSQKSLDNFMTFVCTKI